MRFWPHFLSRSRRIIILGLPKSGTTALHYGIKHALPRPATQLFEPMSPEEIVAQQTTRNLLVKVLPTSWPKPLPISLLDSFSHRIFLVRDPRDVLVSRMLYDIWNTAVPQEERKVQEWLEVLEHKRQQPHAISMGDLLTITAEWRGRSLEQELGKFSPATELLWRLQQEAPAHCVQRYETMVQGAVEPLEHYLGLKLAKPFQVGEEVSRVERTRASGSWKHWFTPKDETTLRPLLATYMQAYGYDKDWDLAAVPEIPQAHSTDYVRRIVNQKRALAKLAAL